MNTDEIRKAWNEAYKSLVADISDTLTLEEICCMFFEFGWKTALERNSAIQWQTEDPKEVIIEKMKQNLDYILSERSDLQLLRITACELVKIGAKLDLYLNERNP